MRVIRRELVAQEILEERQLKNIVRGLLGDQMVPNEKMSPSNSWIGKLRLEQTFRLNEKNKEDNSGLKSKRGEITSKECLICVFLLIPSFLYFCMNLIFDSWHAFI